MAEVVATVEMLDRRLGRAEDALLYISGVDVPEYDSHPSPETVARDYFATRLGP